MKENNESRRKDLVCYLLRKLKDICLQLKELSGEMGGSADLYLEKAFFESNDEIMSLVKEYNGNIGQVEEITRQMTGRMNEWVTFTTDEKNLSRFLFPLRFYFEKRAVKNFIDKSRDQISERVIRNRFVREKLEGMEEKLRCKAVVKIEMEEKFKSFNDLMSLKKEVLEHLSYLMPTIPDLCPVEFSADDIEHLILKLTPIG
jgi:hypothetical protein